MTEPLEAHEHITSDDGTGWCPESERLARENGELGLLLNLAARRLAAEDSDRDEPIHPGFLKRIAETGFGVLTNPGEEATGRLGDYMACVRCGKPAEGVAEINGDRYCHDDNHRPSCYERESWERTAIIGKQSVQLVNPGEEAKPEPCHGCEGRGTEARGMHVNTHVGLPSEKPGPIPCRTCKVCPECNAGMVRSEHDTDGWGWKACPTCRGSGNP